MLILWIKAFHIIAVVSWFAALFYLPRLFVYHAMVEKADIVSNERFKVMERKLFRGICTPAMIATIVFGAWVSSLNWAYYSSASWYWLKIGLVVILVIYNQTCWHHVKKFRDDKNTQTHKYFRYFNEVPTLLLIAVVLLVVLKLPA